MQNPNIIKRDIKTFTIISFATGISIIVFSLVGHFLTPTRLIPWSFVGGTIGLLLGAHFSYRRNYIRKADLFPVVLCSLISFGVVSFVIVFNFNNPLLIVGCFPLIGLATVTSNHYFAHHPNVSASKIYGTLGLILAFPALYFAVASIWKFQMGYDFLFGFFENLLSRTNGQANFNAITPFLFAGGLLLAFGLNLFSQIEITGTNTNIFSCKIQRVKIKALNLAVVIMTGLIGLTILSYLALEN
jgi:hypothetical protein